MNLDNPKNNQPPQEIRVVVCSGTTCFLMGAGELLALEGLLGETGELKALSSRVRVQGSPCMELCKGGAYGKAPFAKVNETLISQATPPKVLEEIKRQVGIL